VLLGWSQSAESEISEFDLVAKQRTVLIKAPPRDVASPRYSPDGKWISFMERTAPETRQIWVAPLEEGASRIPPARWIAITDNTSMDREARWSDDGSWLYFTSNRDGFQCVWAQRLDPSTKQPVGSAVPLHHFHSALLGLTLQDSGQFGLSVGAGRMVISLGAATGNIWLMRQP
jgi:dipeptidyl aminopeptidase/acylaminoacyl peptidase